MTRRLFWLLGVGNQAGDEIDKKVGAAAVAGVFNLGDILELVSDGLGNETFACQQLVLERDESIAHVFAKRCDHMKGFLCPVWLLVNSICLEELLCDSFPEINVILPLRVHACFPAIPSIDFSAV